VGACSQGLMTVCAKGVLWVCCGLVLNLAFVQIDPEHFRVGSYIAVCILECCELTESSDKLRAPSFQLAVGHMKPLHRG
jgi:hypothetical protein